MNLRNFALIGVFILVMLGMYSMMGGGQAVGQAAPKPITYTELLRAADKGAYAKVEIHGEKVTATAKDAAKTRYTTTTPVAQEDLLRRLEASGADISVKSSRSPIWMQVVMGFLPILLIVGIWIFFMRQMQGGARGAMGFGKSKARLLTENKNRVTFEDVAGVDEAKEELNEIVDFLKDPAKFQRLGGKIPKGALLVGPPGTGKTLLARAVAGEAGVPFFSISGSDFVEMFVGVGASRVRDMFEQAKKNAPCIIFIDEIDAVGRHRGAGLGGGHDEREQTLNQLLVEMDGFESNEGVIIIAATNRPDVLDPAILRPGRFDRRITVSRPDVRGREAILRVHTKKTPLAPDVDLEVIARGTPGFAGADLENLVNEAALLAARMDKDALGMSDFELAKDKVMMGSERRSMVMTEDEKWNTAVHEAGHAVVMLTNAQHDPVHKVTIIPRGRALGLTMPLPKGDVLGRTKDQFEAQIQAGLGGRIAELLFFGKLTTGAANDIRQVTDIARAMVCEFGMSDKLGPLAYGHDEGSPFLGRDFTQRQSDYSEQTAREIDQEVRRIIQVQFDQVTELLTSKRDTIEAIAKALMDRETLDHEELVALLEGRELPKRERVIIPTYADKERKEKDKRKVASIFGTTPPKPATS